jgi:ElaB/YqjD/DUF883 family membrane-anchored ribosome-binding protein
MFDIGTPRGRFGRRALTAVAVLGIAATGAAWTGCGDDNEDEVNEAINEANEQVESISEEAQQQAEEAQQQAEEATDEALDQAEEAQDDAEQQLEEEGVTTTTNP